MGHQDWHFGSVDDAFRVAPEQHLCFMAVAIRAYDQQTGTDVFACL